MRHGEGAQEHHIHDYYSPQLEFGARQRLSQKGHEGNAVQKRADRDQNIGAEETPRLQAKEPYQTVRKTASTSTDAGRRKLLR